MKKKILVFFSMLVCSLFCFRTVKASSIPEKFSLKAYNDKCYVTSDKQQISGTCWDYAAINGVESNLLMKGLTDKKENELDISEYQLLYFVFHDEDSNGKQTWDELGNVKNMYTNWLMSKAMGTTAQSAVSALSSWVGPTIEDDSTDESKIPSNVTKFGTLDADYAYQKDVAHLENAPILDGSDKQKIKSAIMKYGACSYEFYSGMSTSNLYKDSENNYTYATNYGGEKQVSNHVVSIIGWDDNYSKEHFGNTYKPKNNGAWLVKDSSAAGYIQYISYENVSSSKFYFYDFGSAENYQYNYQYDGLADNADVIKDGSSYGEMGNIFIGSHNDTVKAVSFYTKNPNTKYEVSIYTDVNGSPDNGSLQLTQSGTEELGGYHTISLNKGVYVKKGQKYSVVVKILDEENGNPLIQATGCNHYNFLATPKNSSFYRFGDSSWTDVRSAGDYVGAMRIKAFADSSIYSVYIDKDSSKNCNVAYTDTQIADGNNFSFQITPQNGYSINQMGVFVNGEYLLSTDGKYTIKNVTDDVVIRVIDPTTSFGIHYELNGGTSGGELVNSYNYTIGKTLVNDVTRKGYTFGGWYDENGNKITKVTTADYGEKTLYAAWEPINYRIDYHSGTSKDSVITQYLTYGVDVEILKCSYTSSGYSFTNWNTKADGSGSIYLAGATVNGLGTTEGEVVDLYAQWDSNCYQIDFNSNSGSGSMGEISATYGSSVQLPENQFIKKGYLFKGWSLTSDGEVLYQDEGEAANLTSVIGETVTLYAQWKPISYRIAYYGNGADSGTMDYQTVSYDTTVSLLFRRFWSDGYNFAGWNTKADGSGTAYTNEEEVTNLTSKDGDIILLYAQWTPGSYPINYIDGRYDSQEYYTYGEIHPLLGGQYKPGYTFGGWYDNEKYTGDAVVSLSSTDYGKKFFYAKWIPIEYTITYDYDGGALEDGKTNPTIYTHDDTFTLNNPVKKGYIFKCWNGTSINPYKAPTTLTITGESEDKELKAIWEKDPSYVEPTPSITPTQTPVVTDAPEITEKPVETVKPTVVPTQTPMVTEKPVQTPVITVKPTVVPTQTPVVTVEPTQTPVITTEPTQIPTETPKATETPIETIKPVIEPTNAPTKNKKQNIVKGITYEVHGSYAWAIKADKAAKSLTFASTVTINGKKYKVTKIKERICKDNKKLKSVILGKYITTIGTNAFRNCSNLKTVTFQGTKIKKIGKYALARIYKKYHFKAPKSKKKAYMRMIRRSGSYWIVMP